MSTSLGGDLRKHDVAIGRYEQPILSLRRLVQMAGGFARLPSDARILVKPNFTVWYEGASFPPYGVLTTARILEDVLILLKEQGFRHITVAEGVVEAERNSKSLMELVAVGMGLGVLEKRYGVRLADVHRGSFRRVSIAGGWRYP